jgi:hypothetical protein
MYPYDISGKSIWEYFNEEHNVPSIWPVFAGKHNSNRQIRRRARKLAKASKKANRMK